jgi:serine/threonine protein kinase
MSDAAARTSVDFWALGCVLFQMLVSKPPFRGETEYLTFQKVVNFEMREFPDDFDEAAKDLILLLLNTNQDKRLGAGANGTYNILSIHLSLPSFVSSIQESKTLQVPVRQYGENKIFTGVTRTGIIVNVSVRRYPKNFRLFKFRIFALSDGDAHRTGTFTHTFTYTFSLKPYSDQPYLVSLKPCID